MEEIARRRPVDRTAARVTQVGPKGLESRKKITQVHSDTPLPLRSVPLDMPDLRGRKFGLLEVVGLLERPENAGRNWLAKWSCRCVCGQYVTRSTKAVRNPHNDQDRCDRCREVVHLRRRSTYLHTGRNFDQETR